MGDSIWDTICYIIQKANLGKNFTEYAKKNDLQPKRKWFKRPNLKAEEVQWIRAAEIYARRGNVPKEVSCELLKCMNAE